MCLTCGNKWETNVANAEKSKIGCPRCAKQSEIKQRCLGIKHVKSLVKDSGHLYLDSNKYRGNKSRYLCECKKHGKFYFTPDRYKNQGSSCPSCGYERGVSKQRFAYSYVLSMFDKRGYTLLDKKYIRSTDKLRYICPNGHNGKMSFAHFKNGHGCKECANESLSENRMTPFLKIKEYISDTGNTLVSKDRKKKSEKLKIRCPEGHTFFILWNSFQQGKRCPKCNSSNGECSIREKLTNLKVGFIEQKRFNGCRDILSLPFDFYLPKKNVCIEYQGRQHYEPVEYFGGKKTFESRKRRDKIKRDFCKKEGIKLIEIPYWEFDNIEKILKKELL